MLDNDPDTSIMYDPLNHKSSSTLECLFDCVSYISPFMLSVKNSPQFNHSHQKTQYEEIFITEA